MDSWKIALMVAGLPLWLPVFLLASMTILICRYNIHISVLDNLLCVVMYYVMVLELAGDETTLMESERKMNADAWEQYIATRHDLEYTIERVKVESDGSTVDVHMTRPKDQPTDARLPIFVNFHGGGMKCGSPFDSGFLDLVKDERYSKSAMCVSVDYRLSLHGHQYPKSIDDCMAAVRSLSPLTNRMIISGASAGGYMTLAVALRCRDEQLPLAHCIPIISSTHIGVDELFGSEFGSSSIFGRANSCPVEIFQHSWRDLWVKKEDWSSKAHRGHDLRTWDLAGVAPCTFIDGTWDVGSAHSEEMHRRMHTAGVEVERHVLRATHCWANSRVRKDLGHVLDQIYLGSSVPDDKKTK